MSICESNARSAPVLDAAAQGGHTVTLLPLKFTPFEQSLWVDDYPAYPWNILVRLRFSGRLDRELFERSLRTVLARHPFFQARVRKRWTKRNYWEPSADGVPLLLHWNEHEFGSWPMPRHLQLTAGEALEVWVRSEAAESEVLMQLNHIAADGAGTFQILDELLQVYAADENGTDATLPKLEPQRLKRRIMYGHTVWGLLKLAPKLAVGIRGIRQFLGRKPIPLLPHDAAPRESALPANFPFLRTHTFTSDETAALRSRAKRSGFTLNDLLVRDLFLVLLTRGRRDPQQNDWLRLAVPIDMRMPADATLPAANIVSMIFLDRRPSDANDPAALLSGIRDEMNEIKHNHLGLIYLIMLAITDMVPGLMAWFAKRQKFTSSAAFSNLMRPLENSPLPRDDAGNLQVGSVTLRSLEIYAPLRPYTCAAYCAGTYAGRLTLGLNADPRFLSPQDADELLSEFVAHVRTTFQQD